MTKGTGMPEATPPLSPTGSRPAMTPLAVIEAWLSPLAGRHILDVGCGGGALARALIGLKASVCGVDPLAEAVRAAAETVPGATFRVAGGEALPFADRSFDAVILQNSFHHVPATLMPAALAEALRVSRGPVLIIEPLAEGPFFEAMRPVEDETAMRHAAQQAIAACAGLGQAIIARELVFEDVRHFSGVDAFLARIVAVDPSRAEAARRLRPQVETLLTRWGTPEAAGIRLSQPHRVVLLHHP